jgi:hypothetical protein
MPRRRHGERTCLASCRLNDRSDWIIAELITREPPASLIASNACQQQRGESIPNHNVLNQLTYRDLRRCRPIPRVRWQLTHDPFELSRRCVDQLHVAQASAEQPGRRDATTGLPGVVGLRVRCSHQAHAE